MIEGQPQPAQPRTEQGKFDHKPPAPEVNKPIQEAQKSTNQIIREALAANYGDKKPVDDSAPKGQNAQAKTDPASKKDSATAKAKPEPSSKDATRPSEKILAKARKALELEGWSEEDLDGLDEARTISIGTKYQEKHAKADREKREAAEAAKKATGADQGKQKPAVTATETAKESEDDLSEYVKAAEEHFKGFEAETDEGTKAFRTAQAKFVKAGVDRATARLEARLADMATKYDEAMENVTRGLRGESALNRALDRIANDIPQVDETDVRQKLTNRIAALASDPETAEEIRNDLRSVVRREALALGLKDEKAEREKAADAELRAAKEAGQPFTGHREPEPQKELQGASLIRATLREEFSKRRSG